VIPFAALADEVEAHKAWIIDTATLCPVPGRGRGSRTMRTKTDAKRQAPSAKRTQPGNCFRAWLRHAARYYFDVTVMRLCVEYLE
jgi:hypothetical protein